jgi:L-alanine-DL-glutamate epimerase-like enolase superfamily enzyme
LSFFKKLDDFGLELIEQLLGYNDIYEHSSLRKQIKLRFVSLTNFTLPGDISSSFRHYLEDIVDPPFLINPDGTMDVPEGPGIGVEVNMSQLKKMTVRSEVFNANRYD